MSERQLHEPIRVTEVAEFGFAVRSCEMEACSELKHRTKVNLQAGMLTWASGPSSVTPISDRGQGVVEAGAAGHLCVLPREISIDPSDGTIVQLIW